jgi:hypothetical protein
MKAGLWRVIALFCIAASIGFAIYQTTQPVAGDFGMLARATVTRLTVFA